MSDYEPIRVGRLGFNEMFKMDPRDPPKAGYIQVEIDSRLGCEDDRMRV